MNSLQQYLVPYLLSQVAAIVFLMIAYKSTKLTRLLFAVTFLGASAVNLNLGLNNPDTYIAYGGMALPFYRDFINGWFSQHNHIIVPSIAVGQFLIGLGMLLRGWWVRVACIGAIMFLLGITPLMTGSAFPFPLLVSWAAWIVLNRDDKKVPWKSNVSARERTTRGISPAVLLSWISWMLALVASSVGLFASGIYRDNTFVKTAWEANDHVTLFVILPALLFVQLNKKTTRTRLLWAGLLVYLVYNYAFYLFGASFNVAFPIYAGIVACATWAVVDVLGTMQVAQLRVTTRYRKWIVMYLLLIAAMLFAIEVPPIIGFSFTNTLPDIVVKTGHPTSIVYALDLTLVLPTMVVAGYWLWKQKPWGYILAALMLIKAATYGLVLCSGTFLLMFRGIDSDPLLPFYLFITIGGIFGFFLLFPSSERATSVSKHIEDTQPSLHSHLEEAAEIKTS